MVHFSMIPSHVNFPVLIERYGVSEAEYAIIYQSGDIFAPISYYSVAPQPDPEGIDGYYEYYQVVPHRTRMYRPSSFVGMLWRVEDIVRAKYWRPRLLPTIPACVFRQSLDIILSVGETKIKLGPRMSAKQTFYAKNGTRGIYCSFDLVTPITQYHWDYLLPPPDSLWVWDELRFRDLFCYVEVLVNEWGQQESKFPGHLSS